MEQCQTTEIWPQLQDSNQDASIIMGNCVEIIVKTATKEAMQNCFDLYFSLRKTWEIPTALYRNKSAWRGRKVKSLRQDKCGDEKKNL